MSTHRATELARTEWGSGVRKVLLVHGLSSHSGTWWRIGPSLASLGCTVTAVDLRGHGRSPHSTSYALDDVASDVAALDQRWDLIVGHSMGGPVATLVSLRGEQGRLLLLDPVFDVADSDFDDLLDDQVAELENENPNEIQELYPRWHIEDCRQKAIAVGLTSLEAVAGYLRDNQPFHFFDMLNQCRIETLILGSDPVDGTLFQPESMHEIHNQLITYRMVVGCGHSIPRERPDLVVSAARELLFSNPGF